MTRVREDDRKRETAQTVVYIGGSGRSGSTLLDRMLGEVPGFVAVGETRHLWREGLIQDRLCGCGERFGRCGFWRSVGHEAFGGWAQVDAERLLNLERSVARQRHIPMISARRDLPSFDERFRAYSGTLSRLYRAIGKVAGAEVVVDSTKDPVYAQVLSASPGIDLRIVHLVRDSRGVAFSWGRVVATGDTPGRNVYLHRYKVAESGARWLTFNALVELIGRRSPYVRIRYEDLVRFPTRCLESVAGLAGRSLPDGAFAFVSDGEVVLQQHHTVAGNPTRLANGHIHLRPDQAWEGAMRRGPKVLVGALTWPLLVRYGYPLRTGRPRGDEIEVRSDVDVR